MPSTPTPRQIATRLSIALVPLTAGVVAVSWFHPQDAQAKGESVIPVVVGVVLSMAVLVATLVAALRPTRGLDLASSIQVRSRRIARWAGIAAAAVALLGGIARCAQAC